jgi:hypothetical protein
MNPNLSIFILGMPMANPNPGDLWEKIGQEKQPEEEYSDWMNNVSTSLSVIMQLSRKERFGRRLPYG